MINLDVKAIKPVITRPGFSMEGLLRFKFKTIVALGSKLAELNAGVTMCVLVLVLVIRSLAMRIISMRCLAVFCAVSSVAVCCQAEVGSDLTRVREFFSKIPQIEGVEFVATQELSDVERHQREIVFSRLHEKMPEAKINFVVDRTNSYSFARSGGDFLVMRSDVLSPEQTDWQGHYSNYFWRLMWNDGVLKMSPDQAESGKPNLNPVKLDSNLELSTGINFGFPGAIGEMSWSSNNFICSFVLNEKTNQISGEVAIISGDRVEVEMKESRSDGGGTERRVEYVFDRHWNGVFPKLMKVSRTLSRNEEEVKHFGSFAVVYSSIKLADDAEGAPLLDPYQMTNVSVMHTLLYEGHRAMAVQRQGRWVPLDPVKSNQDSGWPFLLCLAAFASVGALVLILWKGLNPAARES